MTVCRLFGAVEQEKESEGEKAEIEIPNEVFGSLDFKERCKAIIKKYSLKMPILTPGAVVTTSKNDVDYIVTEYGVAHLRGRSLGERARQLIAIAHPDFRDELTFEAKKRGIMI